ncbi:MAG: 2Fe-2S iron-sulfur cluster-binding protein [Proteobacteria bacterium]|nr:2Fe-2S iron-sulfur cluster-binding protein [Pseudomonadota bacterium]
MSGTEINLLLNGKPVSKAAEPRTHLADFLREDLLLTGTHLGCEQGVCGACTVFVDGRPTRACITLAIACDASDVRTVEGFEVDPLMVRIRDAFTRHHGLQCGFCTPGMLTTAYDIIRRVPGADATRIRRELSGNLCRCTGYAGIVAAIEDVLANEPPIAPLQPMLRAKPKEVKPVLSGSDAAPTRRDTDGATQQPGTTGAALPDPASFADALHLTQSLTLHTAASDAWAILSDPARIVSCVPGASLDGPAKGEIIEGQCVVALGPIKATFRGSGSIQVDHTNKTGKLIGTGRDTVSRTKLDGMLVFAVQETGPDSCRLDLDMRYRLNGPLSQFGRPELVAEIAERLLQEVGAAIERRVQGGNDDAPAPIALNGLSLLARSIKAMILRFLGRG